MAHFSLGSFAQDDGFVKGGGQIQVQTQTQIQIQIQILLSPNH